MSRHVIVDGSNLATEGRTLPSLKQLEEAIASYREEDPEAELVVVVDATFEHRVESKKEKERFKAQEASGKIVTPPAGAVGRGDAFILKIAQKMNAVVLSNDSFQEFHGEYPWLFESGRLVGGKPVPSVGWIFTPRTPVRGPKSKEATKHAPLPTAPIKKLTLDRPDGSKARIGDTYTPKTLAREPLRVHQLGKRLGIDSKSILALAKKAKVEVKGYQSMVEADAADKISALYVESLKISLTTLAKELSAKPAELLALAQTAGLDVARTTSKIAPAEADLVSKAWEKSRRAPSEGNAGAASTASPLSAKRNRRSRSSNRPSHDAEQSSEAMVGNSPLDFITFLATHKVGSHVSAVVTGFSSHGASAQVLLDDDKTFECYVPTARLGSPPPRRARDVLTKGKEYSFVLADVDAPRRVAELALSATVTSSVRGAKPKVTKSSGKKNESPAVSAPKTKAPKDKAVAPKVAQAPAKKARSAAKGVAGKTTATTPPLVAKKMTKAASKAPASKKRG